MVGTAIIFALSGCSIYDAIDQRLHQPPEIEENANYSIGRYEDGTLGVDFTVFVSDGDVALFYYSCHTGDEWKSEREVGSQEVADGKAENSHITECGTKLMVQVVVYNNFRKRSQRHTEMVWLIDVHDYVHAEM